MATSWINDPACADFKSIIDKCHKIENEQIKKECFWLLEALVNALKDLEEIADLGEDTLKLWSTLYALFFSGHCEYFEMLDVAFEKFLPYFAESNYRCLPNWPGVKQSITESLDKIVVMRDANNPYWSVAWGIAAILLNEEMIAENDLFNRFLIVLEPTLKTNNEEQSEGGWSCWQVLLQIFNKTKQMSSNSRLKLFATPLDWSDGIDEATDVTIERKFTVWWYALCAFNNTLKSYVDKLVIPFLRYCFGAIEAWPDLCWAKKPDGLMKRSKEMSLQAICCVVQMIEPSDTIKSALVGPVMSPWPRTSDVTRLLVNVCGEATLIFVRRIDDDDCDEELNTIAVQLWRNLAMLLNEGRDIETMFLALRNLKMLADILGMVNSKQRTRADKLFLSVMAAFCGKSFAFLAKNFTIPAAVYVEMLLTVFKTIAPLVDSHPLQSMEPILSLICNVFVTQTCDRTIEIVEAFHNTILSQNNESSYRKRNALLLLLWMTWAKMISSWLDGHMGIVKQWNESVANETKLRSVLYNTLMWPLGHTMDEFGGTNFTSDWKKLAASICTMEDNDRFMLEATRRISSIASGHQYHEKLGVFAAHLISMVDTATLQGDDAELWPPLLRVARMLLDNRNLNTDDLGLLMVSIERFHAKLRPNDPLGAELRTIMDIRMASEVVTSSRTNSPDIVGQSAAKRNRCEPDDNGNSLVDLECVPYCVLLEFIADKLQTSFKFRDDLRKMMR